MSNETSAHYIHAIFLGKKKQKSQTLYYCAVFCCVCVLENQKKKGCATLVRRRRNYTMFRFSTKNRRHNTIKCCNEIIICNQSIWLNYQDNSFISIYKSVWLISAVSVYQIARQGGEKSPIAESIFDLSRPSISISSVAPGSLLPRFTGKKDPRRPETKSPRVADWKFGAFASTFHDR